MTASVIIGGIYLVNSTGTPVAGGAATAAATTPFAILKNWRPTPAEPIIGYGHQLGYSEATYAPVQETIPISVIGSTHVNAVARLQELKRAIRRANNFPTLMHIIPDGSSTEMQAEISNAVVREVAEDESGLEGWEGWSEIQAEIVCTRSPFFGQYPGEDPDTFFASASLTNTGTGTPDNVEAYPSSIDGDLANEGQPTWLTFTPATSGANTIFYVASIYSRTYSTTGSGAKTTSSTTGASSALNVPTFAAFAQKMGLKARVLFRFTNNTSNVQVRVEVRANSGGTTLFAGPWITPTSGSATLYDMGRISLDFYRAAPGFVTASAQLYIGYRSTDGASATATLGYNEFLLYYDFCRLDSATAVNSSSGASGYRFELYNFMLDDVLTGSRPLLPLDTPVAVVYDNTTNGPIDTLSIRGRPPRAIEGGSLYMAWMTAGNVHSATATGAAGLFQAPLWRTLRGAD